MKHASTLFLLAATSIIAGCTHEQLKSLSYDPPGATVTTDKEITLQPRRIIGFSTSGVWVSNEFTGARLNDFYQVNDSLYAGIIAPENAPVNNSAWYAFKIWADRPCTVLVELNYQSGSHRYYPKLSRDGEHWHRLDSSFYAVDTTKGTAQLRLALSPDTTWVAGQELLTTRQNDAFVQELATLPFVTDRVIGYSTLKRPLRLLEISESEAPNRYVVVIGRQHPPEVTGSINLMGFVRALCDSSELAHAFRREFCTVVIPLVNPDGVDLGHWRHNAAGVDLNRDWFQFNQPETRAIRDALQPLNGNGHRVYFCVDFHSTQEDVFYTLAKDLETVPAKLTDAWLDSIRVRMPEYPLNESPSGLGSPVSKNWFYKTFGAPALTLETGDESDRQRIAELAGHGAAAMMALLLKAAQTSQSRE